MLCADVQVVIHYDVNCVFQALVDHLLLFICTSISIALCVAQVIRVIRSPVYYIHIIRVTFIILFDYRRQRKRRYGIMKRNVSTRSQLFYVK